MCRDGSIGIRGAHRPDTSVTGRTRARGRNGNAWAVTYLTVADCSRGSILQRSVLWCLWLLVLLLVLLLVVELVLKVVRPVFAALPHLQQYFA